MNAWLRLFKNMLVVVCVFFYRLLFGRANVRTFESRQLRMGETKKWRLRLEVRARARVYESIVLRGTDVRLYSCVDLSLCGFASARWCRWSVWWECHCKNSEFANVSGCGCAEPLKRECSKLVVLGIVSVWDFGTSAKWEQQSVNLKDEKNDTWMKRVISGTWDRRGWELQGANALERDCSKVYGYDSLRIRDGGTVEDLIYVTARGGWRESVDAYRRSKSLFHDI